MPWLLQLFLGCQAVWSKQALGKLLDKFCREFKFIDCCVSSLFKHFDLANNIGGVFATRSDLGICICALLNH